MIKGFIWKRNELVIENYTIHRYQELKLISKTEVEELTNRSKGTINLGASETQKLAGTRQHNEPKAIMATMDH